MMNIQHDTRPVELLRPSEPEPVRKPEREVEHGPPRPRREPRRTSLAGAWRVARFVRCGGLWRLASLSTSYRSPSDGGTNARLRSGSSDRPCAREPGDGVGLLAWLDPGLQFGPTSSRASGYIVTRNVLHRQVASRRAMCWWRFVGARNPASNRSGRGDAGAKWQAAPGTVAGR